MSFMQRLIGSRGGGAAQTDPNSRPQDTSLGLMHLRKLFTEFKHPATEYTQKDQEEKLYKMLPIFCKIFGNVPANSMQEKFSDILQFCSHVSKLMVTEVRRRASNQSTEEASCAIVKFLEIESTEESSAGWMLLTSINLLSVGTQALIDCMTAASLPSTLVKCLYLFFDLPELVNAEALEEGCEFTPQERRVLLQKVFVQVLVRLCNQPSPAEELARKDDLSLLFSAITSWCPTHNVVWRTSAGEVLVTLSRHGLTNSVTKYIHDKGCVRHCVENMQRAQDLSPLDLVEMFVTVFCFLKDSSEVSHVLLDDFKSCQGYTYLSEFILRLELDVSEESVQALRNLVLLVGSLTTCGYAEIKPSTAATGSIYQIPGFTLPQPAGKEVVHVNASPSSSVSVRNIQAFQVLQNVFLKAQSSALCNTILDVMNSIYHQDNANYFILVPQNTLSQFAEKIHTKSTDVQEKFFELFEFIVFDLTFVPCKELISLSLVLKTQHSVASSILIIRSLQKIAQFHVVFKDVYREVGMLEVLVTCLHRFAALLKDPQADGVSDVSDTTRMTKEQRELGFLVMEVLAMLLSNNNQNTSVFRECGGARCAHNMVPFVECRQQALSIVQQLVLSPGGDDDMGTLLGLMNTAEVTDLELKTAILKSLLNVLRESHRTRTVFRKVGGFVYVMSVLVIMEGCLADPPRQPWDKVDHQEVLLMLKAVFSSLTVAMRYEPANAKFFSTDVRYDSLTEAVRLLGCFSTNPDITVDDDDLDTSQAEYLFEDTFIHSKEPSMNVPVVLSSACHMIRYLYDMGLDAFERPYMLASHKSIDSPATKRHTMIQEKTSPSTSPKLKRASTGSLSLPLTSPHPDHIIHAGAIMSIFHLLPAVTCEDETLVKELKVFVAGLLKNLLRKEHNQQVMCDAGFPHQLLVHGNIALADESHSLHPSLQYMFERLASQSLTPRDLRDFLRLGSPLNCQPADEDIAHSEKLRTCWPLSRHSSVEEKRMPWELEKKLKTQGCPVPLTRVKCLVSMTTPKDARMHGSSVTPAFVEFNMNAEGFGCLYLPSIAPQGPPTPSVVSGVVGVADPSVIGGIGTGERVFPPQSGLTFSSWFCVDKFSVSTVDPHPVRLFTIVRNLQGREENLICLSITLSPRDRCLYVCTQEVLMPSSAPPDDLGEPRLSDNLVKFWHQDLDLEGQWHHVLLIFNRAGIMKNSSVSLFIDGDLVKTQKLHYISPNLGVGGSASPTAFTSVFGYIGTPPSLRRQSRLAWRQGPCHLFEDVVSQATVKNIYTLGPTYIGSFQSPYLEDRDMQGPFISEEKVVFGVHAHAMSQLTIAKMRKIYNKVDSKSIAKQLAMSSHDNATPIRVLHNSAGHLGGYARCLGAILMGYLGVRTFCPMPVAKMLQNVGGTKTLLGLVAMATDVEGLYAAVKALVCVVKSNKQAQHDLDRIAGYQMLAMLYKRKQSLLNSHILHLTFSLVGTIDSGKESSLIPNRKAFEDILCDLEVWHEAPGELQRSLYEHFYELLTDSSEQGNNLRLMREIGLTVRLLHVMRDPRLPQSTLDTMATVVGLLLEGHPDTHSLLKVGQFLVNTIPESHSEKLLVVENPAGPSGNFIIVEADDPGGPSIHMVRLRNTLLDVIYRLLSQSVLPPTQQASSFCEELQRVLGFDWILMFLQSHVHATTVIRALKILLVMFRNPTVCARFRDGQVQYGGGWLKDTELILKQQIGASMLGFNLHHGHGGETREVNTEICTAPGFTVLGWLLPKHNGIPEVYLLLMAMLLGQHISNIPQDIQLNLDSVWMVLFGSPVSVPGVSLTSNKDIQLCPDAAILLLTMVRSMLNPMLNLSSDSWLREYPVTLVQFLLFLYHNQSDFIQLSIQPDFIAALAATLFPYFSPDADEIVTTPEEEFKVAQLLSNLPFPDSDPVVYVRSPERDKSSYLTNHPARKYVIEFLRTIVIDSMSQPVVAKSASVIDIMLEASPEHATRAQHKEYQTGMLKTIMDHLVAVDVLLGDQAALPIMAGGSHSNMAANVFYFTSRVVDKLIQGTYTRESKEIFDFICKLISQAKRKSSGISVDSIYKSLNRTILFQLSRKVDSVSGQTQVLDSLHKLTSHRGLVFAPSNPDSEFLACLCYCLLNLTDDTANRAPQAVVSSSHTNLNESQPIQTTWHLPLEHSPTPGSPSWSSPSRSRAETQGLGLVAKAAKRVWEELYVHKKPALEEIFRTQMNNRDLAKTADFTAPDLYTVRPLIQEMASRIWVNYAENERKGNFTTTERIPPQIKTIQMVGSKVLNLARGKSKRELPLKTSPSTSIHQHEYMMCSLDHMLLVKDLVEIQARQREQTAEYMGRYLQEQWDTVEHELLRERGLWGPIVGSRLDKWMLDMTEGPFRMRKKMVKNDLFYVHYPYRPDMANSPLKYKVPMSNDSKAYYLQYRPQSLFGESAPIIKLGMEELPAIEAEVEERSPEDIMKIPKLLHKKAGGSQQESNDDDEDLDGEKGDQSDSQDVPDTTEAPAETTPDTAQKKADNQAILQLLGEGEKISHMFRCARIQGLENAEGLLLFGREHFHIIDGVTILATKEIKDIDTLPPELHESIIPKSSQKSNQKKQYNKFAYEDIREVHKRRYLLQPIAIEVFSSDGRNYLLAFPKRTRNKVYQKFFNVATAITDNAQLSVSGQKQNARIEAGTGFISTLMGEKSVTQRWERGEINNFQYLMHLNTLAGRSYNDLMQYPVFPWILADYDSEELDLFRSETFRDLSKPMGAQTPDRLKHFNKRFHDWDDPQGETPPYHYGTHYSSAMIVASYLLRLEPFTQTFLNLQGGHFDLADRMFHSVKENWMSASKNNMADVKELIPEFFYLPEFLLNANSFDLGCKQSGVHLDDVVLPPWAKEDPREFIRAHREALESDYVSAHLHEWIDLIFGFRQQGQPAIDAVNVFHHLFYEGNVDIDSIDDPLKKNATIGFINNFGQIPKQLFRRPHPQKKLNVRGLELSASMADRLFFHNVDNLKPCFTPIKELKSAVGQIMHGERYVLAVEQNKVLVPTSYNKYLAWGFSDLSVRIGNYESDKASLIYEGLDNGEILCAACPNSKIFITGGTSCVVNVWQQNVKEKRVDVLQPLYGHTEPVTCVAVSPGYNFIVSGSRDRTCIIWDLNQLVFVRQLRGHTAPVAAVCINELTGDIASCAGTYLHVWSINGDEIACVNTASLRNHQILCVAMSQIMEWDSGNVILTGSSDGVVRMWSIDYVQVPEETKLVVPTKSDTKEETSAADTADSAKTDSNKPRASGARKRSVSCDSYEEGSQSVVNRLKEFKDPDSMTSKYVELGSSVDSNSHFMSKVLEKLEGVGGGRDSSAISGEMGEGLSRGSSLSDLYGGEEGGEEGVGAADGEVQSLKSAGSMSLASATEALDHEHLSTDRPAQQQAVLDQSLSTPEVKSESDLDSKRSLSSEFEVITDSEIKPDASAEDILRKYKKRTKNTLREGFIWQRQLVFRSKLTMHTAFERKDNKDPAAVTAIAISRDHKTVYVGDAKGRIFSWTVTDQPGRVVDHWVRDDVAETCMQCGIRFSLTERRHHCRNCGQVFCSKCSRYETEIRRLRIRKPVRVCLPCYNMIKSQHSFMGDNRK
ncbi:WD repeat and FYVE domain-containing protein 3-like isoform X4 [Mya arenaria]|uniref:WD repeat and FYVE domain-containing protein 3-like isoform X4 n=1 Tax=Mya arenaria TaxID=6604 RepID=UPI0022E50EC6|nr:WD repeat and FYVE domain-containing protein 3-like isoform X4 [Mya arenaria]